MASAEKPIPVIDHDNRGYWEAAQRGELRFQRCTDCGEFRHYPVPMCGKCRSFNYEWALSSGNGTLHSWIVVHHGVHPAYLDLPYVVALVEMEDCGNQHVLCNIDAPPDMLAAGAPIEIYFEERDGFAIPQARLTRAAKGNFPD